MVLEGGRPWFRTMVCEGGDHAGTGDHASSDPFSRLRRETPFSRNRPPTVPVFSRTPSRPQCFSLLVFFLARKKARFGHSHVQLAITGERIAQSLHSHEPTQSREYGPLRLGIGEGWACNKDLPHIYGAKFYTPPPPHP